MNKFEEAVLIVVIFYYLVANTTKSPKSMFFWPKAKNWNKQLVGDDYIYRSRHKKDHFRDYKDNTHFGIFTKICILES